MHLLGQMRVLRGREHSEGRLHLGLAGRLLSMAALVCASLILHALTVNDAAHPHGHQHAVLAHSALTLAIAALVGCSTLVAWAALRIGELRSGIPHPIAGAPVSLARGLRVALRAWPLRAALLMLVLVAQELIEMAARGDAVTSIHSVLATPGVAVVGALGLGLAVALIQALMTQHLRALVVTFVRLLRAVFARVGAQRLPSRPVRSVRALSILVGSAIFARPPPVACAS